MAHQLAKPARDDAEVLRSVDRATAELRRGGVLVLHAGAAGSALVQAAEGAQAAALARMAAWTSRAPLLVLTRQRARSLGLPGPDSAAADPVLLDSEDLGAQAIAEMADPTATRKGPRALPPLAEGAAVPEALPAAAVALAKIARLLPAVLLAPLPSDADTAALAASEELLLIAVEDVDAYRFVAAQALEIAAQGRVPLAGAEDTRIVAFRPSDGGVEHLAIVIGQPTPDRPVLTRLHSECFTGDLLGSLRCDCGDQLRGAIETMSEAGAGVLLYLAQEGRGIGLVNKLRAYSLQDRGADTYEANEQLGFDADERIYLPAAEMLRQLGFHRVRLLTNNPEKVEGLARHGIAVEERVAHSFPANGHNEFYLATKTGRGGHLG